MKRNIWELEIDVSFVSIFSFVSAYLGWESTKCFKEKPVSECFTKKPQVSRSTVNVLVILGFGGLRGGLAILLRHCKGVSQYFCGIARGSRNGFAQMLKTP